MIIGKLSLGRSLKKAPSLSQLQAEKNYDAFVFRDTFTRQKYPLRVLSQASAVEGSSITRATTSSLHDTILANRNNQLMQTFMADSNSKWAKIKKAKESQLPQKMGMVRAPSLSSLATEQNQLRQYLRGEHKLKVACKENKTPLGVSAKTKRTRPSTKKALTKALGETLEDRLCSTACQQIQSQVRTRLLEQFTHLIKPDAFSVQYRSPLLQKFESERVQQFEQQHPETSPSASQAVSRSQQMFKKESASLDEYICQIDELKSKHLREMIPREVPADQRQFLSHAQKGDHFEVEYMLRRQPDLLNCCCEKGNSALHYACKNGDLELARLLLSRSANMQLRNKNGMLAVQLARHFDHPAIDQLLTKAMAREQMLQRITALNKRKIQ